MGKNFTFYDDGCDEDERKTRRSREIAVLGATGSIGKSALDVIAKSNGALRASVLAVKSSVAKAVELARQFQPKFLVVVDENADRTPLGALPRKTKALFGRDALNEVVRRPEIDVVLNAIVGIAGLDATLEALDAGKTVALANKEALVAGGALVMRKLEERGSAALLPVDSEHSAIFQCILSHCNPDVSPQITSDDVERIILTASGGPFRDWTREQLKGATVEDALRHPTWNMGAKVTIDSASMMNKALEIIEARWLFDIEPDRIQVMIHPQSLIHSMVEFVDGAVLAQISPPDMRLPIQFALYGAFRKQGPAKKFDWTKAASIELTPPDFERFPALQLGFEVAKAGGTAGAALNAANEVAVDAFRRGAITFDQIPELCRRTLDSHNYEPNPTLGRVYEIDAWARKEIEKWISR
ncbi:MAG: 1-deoxy-D-xylulose-5-phosphate reductoisomerase [Thermoguttaceae bacterium]|nr:1-deoxy-D-xylulose-5-phosphate reductoisomerase [Thermoguttaceae bacterium]